MHEDKKQKGPGANFEPVANEPENIPSMSMCMREKRKEYISQQGGDSGVVGRGVGLLRKVWVRIWRDSFFD